MRFRITRTVVCIILVQMMLIGFLPVMESTTSAEGVCVPSRRPIVVNASGGGDYTHIRWAIDDASE